MALSDSLDEKTEKECVELLDYFVESGLFEKTEQARLANWGQEPLVFRVAFTVKDREWWLTVEEKRNSLSEVQLDMAEDLADRIWKIRQNREILVWLPDGTRESFVLKRNIPREDLEDTKAYLFAQVIMLFPGDSVLILRVCENKEDVVMAVRVNRPFGALSSISPSELENAYQDNQFPTDKPERYTTLEEYCQQIEIVHTQEKRKKRKQ